MEAERNISERKKERGNNIGNICRFVGPQKIARCVCCSFFGFFQSAIVIAKSTGSPMPSLSKHFPWSAPSEEAPTKGALLQHHCGEGVEDSISKVRKTLPDKSFSKNCLLSLSSVRAHTLFPFFCCFAQAHGELNF